MTACWNNGKTSTIDRSVLILAAFTSDDVRMIKSFGPAFPRVLKAAKPAYWLIATLMLIAAVLIFYGLHHWKSENISYFGSWLSGTLTPALISVGIVTWLASEKAQSNQTEMQKVIAQINERSVFLSHKAELEGNLSYLGSCCLERSRLSHDQHSNFRKEGRRGFEEFWSVLTQNKKLIASQEEQQHLRDLMDQDAAFFLEEFETTMIQYLHVAYSSGLYGHVDRRLQELPQLIEYHKLWRCNPQMVAADQRENFQKFFRHQRAVDE